MSTNFPLSVGILCVASSEATPYGSIFAFSFGVAIGLRARGIGRICRDTCRDLSV